MFRTVAIVLLCTYVALTAHVGPQSEFKAWMSQHSKVYKTTEEHKLRYSIWLDNVQKIKDLNTKKSFGSATFGLTKFTDMTTEEFRAYAQCHHVKQPRIGAKECWDFDPRARHMKSRAAPDSMDWRTKGAVTDVKDQGQCGSCWSFATTGTLEGANFLKNGKLTSLSEQNLIDCSGSCCYNTGCDGGRTDWAIEYVVQNLGIDTEASYPYKAEDGTCNFNPSNVGGNASHCITLPVGDETSLMNAVATYGPVAVAISVDDAFANYQSGVFTDDDCPNSADQLDHAVLVVGYGTDSSSGQDYWIVKNSWGKSWGDGGYIKMRRNYNNMCGIATDAVYPYF